MKKGSLKVTAPAPGRYKIAAIRGTERWETYVLIRPKKVVPEIRGASFAAFEPLDREYASEVLAIAKRAGMTWADRVQTGFINFDSDSLEVQAYCERCPGSMPLEDFEWLIDEAHQQGFKVSLDLGVWARREGCLDELQSILEGVRLKGGGVRPFSVNNFTSSVIFGPPWLAVLESLLPVSSIT